MCKWFAWESDGAVVILPTLTCDSVNVDHGDPDDRTMITGLYTVRDISCSKCKTVVGWTYVKAFEDSQKYKEDKFILEKALLEKHTDVA
ncbi:hypothetical protein VKS41_009424 [Umbelopsis sp. WA50703]